MTVDYDFIIVGSGVLGCLAYDYIASRDNKVLLIAETNEIDHKNYILQKGSQQYSGIVRGRKKGLGGTSLLWGGAMNINYDKKFIKQCQLDPIKFEIEKKSIFNFFGIRNINTKSKKKIYSSKKYSIYEEEIVWPSFRKRNVFQNLKQKYSGKLNIKIGTYKKIDKKGDISRLFVKTKSNKTEIFTCKKVVFCMGFFDNVRENLKNNENLRFKEHLSSKIGVISNTEKFPLSSSLFYKFNYFQTKRYEIFDKKQKRSIGFLHLSTNKSDFLIRLRDLLICFQSFKFPSFHLMYDLLRLSHQILPIIKNMIFNKGDISNKMNKSDIHLVIDKVQYSTIKKSNNQLSINWNISDLDIKVFKNLKLEMNKIIKSMIDQSLSPKKFYRPYKISRPKEIFHPFLGCNQKKWENNNHIWSGTHALNELGSLSPTLASHFLKMSEYENARKIMYNYSNKK